MAGMKELREQAKASGIPAREIRSAESSAELRRMIREAGNGSASRTTRKRVVKKAVARKATPKRRGRPPGSKNKTTASAPAKRGRPKGSTTRKSTTRKASTKSNGNGGRFLLGKINWSKVGDWNPREGTVPDQIVKALKKFKGDRDKTYNALRPKLKSLVPPSTRAGRKRSQSEREDYLRYLISRNAWAFAMATGQHTPSTDRVEYGTGGTGEGKFKPARKNTRKAAPKRTAAKRGPGRPKGSKNAPKPAAKRRGRPPGSKNKPKATTRRKATRR